MKTTTLIASAFGLSSFLACAQITPGFEPGNLIVLRVGSPSTTLASSGDPVFLDEYTTNGVATNSIAVPNTGSNALVIGSAASEGAISRSANGNFIVMVGYNTNLTFGSSLPSSTSATVPRGLATIDFNGNYAFITNTRTLFSGNNIRGGVSDGSNNFWAVGAASGTVYMGVASPTATVQSGLANSEVIGIFNGNLCYSSQKSTPLGVYYFSGLPTTTAATNLLFSTGASSSPYAFAISPDNTVAYVADDRATTAGGGIQKYTNNGAWGLAYTLGTGAGSTVGARGVAVQFGQPPVVYATTAETSVNRLIAISDTNSGAVAAVLATAGNNEVFRGVQLTPQGSAPALAGQLQPQTVAQGQNAVFTVAATGSGTLYYMWESNSAPLTAWVTNTSFTFSTTNDAPEEFSVGVLVSNSWGATSSSAILTINASNALPPAPVITTEPESLAVNAGSEAVFAVTASGVSLSYQWQWNHTNLTDGAFISGSTTATLTLSNVLGGNAGSYTVTITNAGGATNSTAAILAVTDPWIKGQPAGRTYLAGATMDLSVGAIGSQLAYQWTFNGATLADATNAALSILNAAASNSGSYAVVVTGAYGAVTSAVAAVIVAPPQASFFPSNLVVLRVGDGAQTLASSGNTLFLDQFASNGVYVNTMALPDSGAAALLISGVATSEGYMTSSADGRLLAVAGYNTNRGALTNSLSSSTNVPRAIGTIDGAGQYTLAASAASQYSGDNLRAGATDGNNNFWGAGSAGGTWYFGNAFPEAVVQTSVANCRVINIVNGSLVFSTQSGANGLYSLNGLPETNAVTNLVFATGSSSSPEDFAINSAGNLAYVADDSSAGGIQRWELVAGSWTNIYTLGGGVAKIGARSLTVNFSGANPVIYAVTAETAANRLIAITDTGAASAAVTLASCPSSELFRAVKFSPALNPFPTPELDAAILVGGQFQFSLSGVAGYHYVIEASPDLTAWAPIQTNAAPFTFTIANPSGSSRQYFRAVYFP